jgi:hypothetical protein
MFIISFMNKVLILLSALVMSLTIKAQVSDYQNWMSGLDDDAFICQLSIPGAHDACSSSFSGGSAIGALFAGKVQTKSVQQMLPLGARAFDLRPNNKMNIYHGSLQTNYTFSSAMSEIYTYLGNHPTEFCVVVLRHENDGDSGDDNFANTLQSSLSSMSSHLIDFRPNLTVGEARGKIVVMSRDDYNAPIRGGRLAGWPGNTSSNSGQGFGPESWKCPFWVQDYYEYSNVNDKKNAIQAMLNQSYQLAGKYNYTWVVNETSGYNGTGTNSACQANAKATNPHLQQLLASGNYNGPAGLVFMDYCCDGDGSGYYGLSLTKELINHNFRYTMSKQGDPIYLNDNLYVAPRGREMMWDAKFLRLEGPYKPGDYEDASAVSQLDGVTGPANWYKEDFDDSAWETKHFPTASANTGAPYYSQWDGIYNVLFIRREFYVDHDPTIDTYKLYYYHDDDFKVYLNGTLLTSANGWNSDFNNYSTYNIASNKLKVGRNVLAVMIQQNWGGAYFDCGILRTEGTKHTVSLTDDWQTYVAPGHNVDFSSVEVKAYKIVQVSGTSARLEEVTSVPADEAVVLRPDNGARSYSIPVTQNAPAMEDNLLKAATSPFTVTEENAIFCIANINGRTGFFPVGVGVTVPKGKGYLDFSGSSVKPASVFLDDEDDPTAINDLKDLKDPKDLIFNLAGQRLQKMQRGLNIVGKTKVLK